MLKRLILLVALGAAIAACNNPSDSQEPGLSSPTTVLPSTAPSFPASPMASPSAS